MLFILIFLIWIIHPGETHNPYDYGSSLGLFPSVFNIAEGANIYSNTTCGLEEPEIYCKLLSESSSSRQCGICDNSHKDKRHPIQYAIDGDENTWWQAKSLQHGLESNYGTVTLDLKEVFQVAYVLVTTGISPRPGNWILEKSVDGEDWEPWQFFADSDEECWTAFGIEPRKDKPTYHSDGEVICTSYYSKLEPLEHAQIHVSLVNGRPGASGPSRTLVDFTKARFIRFRFLKLQLLPSDSYLLSGFTFLTDDDDSIATQARRYFYSIKDITIGGQCPCNGHANECPVDQQTMKYECKCKHNTCGPLCNQCCSMYNQKRWRPGKFISGNDCERCQCFGHADECYFDPQVEAERKSLNSEGHFEGGGVCIDCRDETVGINCESCRDGFYRPADVSRFDAKPCRRCDCDPISNPGSTGNCYPDDKEDSSKKPGDCRCKKGYAGSKCNSCDRGFHGYPNCIPCSCSLAGTLNGACTGKCECKEHVVGERCDRCKHGYFALHEANAKGCLKCFCYGVTDECTAAELGVEVLQHGEGWKVTDLHRSVVVEPYWSTVTNGVTIAEEDMKGIKTYFWEAPSQYIGNRLVSYGQEIRIRTSWHTARGDTAGSPLRAPDIILEGANMIIAYGTTRYKNRKNATINVSLQEEGWYHIPDNLRQIIDDGTTNSIPDFIGDSVSKVEFMKVLGSLNRMLFRSKYHTDQLEGTLHTAEMEFGSKRSVNVKKTHAVERCNCPPGYEGLSCETCSYGYTRYNETLYEGVCKKCDCNGHAASCDTYTLQCAECQHNTIGSQCERCIDGFYGNPLIGTPADCKPCKCPLDKASNNFSPTCLEVSNLDYDKYSLAPNEYVCNACPRGYAGPHCERCDNGYFGNPLSIGDVCKPCDCNGNSNPYAPDWCDHRTGQCLICVANTGGWKCDQCLPGFYGNALAGRCLPCECNPYGSSSPECDPVNGQCLCKDDKYLGRTCSKCKGGFGNLRAGCRRCNCNTTGSKSDFCDADSGQCDCKRGVTGLVCHKCLPDHYGFSYNGCLPCECHSYGSLQTQCDPFNGNCRCKDFVIGPKCDRCMANYWNLNSNIGCVECQCDPMGSFHNDCNDITGQCACKPGIGGTACDACLAGYWGFSPSGCNKCFPCNKPGHVCDPDTGRCICPPLTYGINCSECSLGTWNYHPYKGCQYCKCHPKGSLSEQCNLKNGKCKCMTGFEGPLCDRCSQGYYNFPNCRSCNCNPAGTDPGECFQDGRCKCDDHGACLCKANVEGKKCASCKLGTFGLTSENPKGCTNCFCFGRTKSCVQSNYFWTQVAFPEGRILTITRGNSPLNVSEGLTLIPFNERDVSIGLLRAYEEPFYWDLPEQFLKDKITSYNGYLRFTIMSDGTQNFKSPSKYPLVQIQGFNGLVLENYQNKFSTSGRYEVRLHEREWMQKESGSRATREMLMIVLQNVKKIIIRATDKLKSVEIQLKGVTIDVGKPVPDQGRILKVASGVEKCDCPDKYASSSCQDPGRGYYRHYEKSSIITETFFRSVGESRPCSCNGRTTDCDPETGLCFNCRQNSSGASCDICAPGYYGNPDENNGCQPCHCPSTKRNFAKTCSIDRYGDFSCNCKVGYSGPKCDRCDYGFYGNPKEDDGECKPCLCNKFGSLSDQCDSNTGQCSCASSEIVGRDCSQCQPRHILTKDRNCKNCDDSGCTSYLLNFVDAIKSLLQEANVTDLDPAPNVRLESLREQTLNFKENIFIAQNNKDEMFKINKTALSTEPQAEIIQLEVNKHTKSAHKLIAEAEELRRESELLASGITRIQERLLDIFRRLISYYVADPGLETSGKQHLKEANRLLEDLKSLDFGETDIKARTELSHSRLLLENVGRLIYGIHEIYLLKENLKNGEQKVDDLLQYIDNGLETTRKTIHLNQMNNQTLYKILGSFTNIMSLQNRGNLSTLSARKNCRKSEKKIREMSDIFSELPFRFGILSGPLGKNLEKEEIGLSGVVEDYRTRYVEPCSDHALHLNNLAKELENGLTSMIGLNAEQTLKAANVYGDIVTSIIKAKKSSNDALNDADLAFKKVFEKDSLKYRTDSSRIKSKDLLQEAEGLKQNSVDLKSLLNDLNTRGSSYSMKIESFFSNLGDFVPELERFSLFAGSSQKANSVSLESLKDAEIAIEKIVSKQSQIQIELKNVANELQSFAPGELENIPRKIFETSKTMQNVEKQAVYLERRDADIIEIDSLVSQNMEKLLDKIGLGSQLASTIKISVANESPENKCIRSYQVNSHASVSNELSLIFGVDNPDEKSGLLVYFPSGKKVNTIEERDFMAIEMVDRKIRFLWNNGRETKSITHNVTIETSSSLSLEDHAWYRITAERIGHIGRLNVRKVRPIFDLPDYHRWVVGESSPEASVLDVQPQDLLYLGGVPEVYKSPALLSDGYLAGVIYDLSLNGKNVGLWDFMDNSGCVATHSGVIHDVVQQHSCYNFIGKGSYATQNNLNSYDPKYLAISLEFKSYDTNSMIFFGFNQENEQFLALELRNGRIYFVIHYGSNKKLKFFSNKSYNSGTWVKVEMARALRNGVLETGVLRIVQNGIGEDLMDTLPDVEFKMSQSSMYFGGFPPDFDIKHFVKKNELNFKDHFSGHLRGITVSNPGSNTLINPLFTAPLLKNMFYGVDANCDSKALKSVLLRGNGFIELKSQPLRRDCSFGFSFKTKQMDGLLILSTFVGQPQEKSQKSFYSISLKDGRLSFLFGSETSNSFPISFESEAQYNDGNIHTVVLIKRRSRVSVYLDDVVINSNDELYLLQEEISAPTTGGLFIGGVPNTIRSSISVMVKSVQNLNGLISDIVFIDNLSVRAISMSNPVSFSNAGIGRDAELTHSFYKIRGPQTEVTYRGETVMQDQEDEEKEVKIHRRLCFGNENDFEIEEGAFGFSGYGNDQFIRRSSTFHSSKKLDISLKFRSTQSNGVLFAYKLRKKRENQKFIIAYLKDNILNIFVYGLKQGSRTLQKSLQDIKTPFRWIQVGLKYRVDSSAHILELFINKEKVHKIQFSNYRPLLPLAKNIYFGKAPKQIEKQNPELYIPFVGCMKGIDVNSNLDSFRYNRRQKKDSYPCFRSIGSGHYFIQKNAFISLKFPQISSSPRVFLHISLEFKTSSLEDKRMFALYKEDSRIIGASLMNGKFEIKFRNKIHSGSIILCPNRWHKIEFSIMQDKSVKISSDGINDTSESMDQILSYDFTEIVFGNSEKEKEESSFLGCLRNVYVNGKNLESLSSVKSVGVVPDACSI